MRFRDLAPGHPPASLGVKGPQRHEKLPSLEGPVFLKVGASGGGTLAGFVHVAEIVAEKALETQQPGGEDVHRPVDRCLDHELPGANKLKTGHASDETGGGA